MVTEPQAELNHGSLNMSIPTTVGLFAYLEASMPSAASIDSIGGGAFAPTTERSLKKLHIAVANSMPVLGEVMLG